MADRPKRPRYWESGRNPVLTSRKIDGLTYRRDERVGIVSKAEAIKAANAIRMSDLNARVIPVKRSTDGKSSTIGYEVWASRKKEYFDSLMANSSKRNLARAYNAHRVGHKSVLVYADELARLGRVKNTGRKNWIGRRKRTKADRLNQKEAEDFLEIQEKLIRETGKTEDEATLEAIKFAKSNRKARESAREKKKRDEKLDLEVAIAEEEARLAVFTDDKRRYEADIPAREILRYNSLELAGIGIGTTAGYAIASGFSLAAFPLIPIATATGFVAAKATRGNWGNVGLKPGVNAAIDWTDDTVSSLAQSLRASKDDETFESSNLWKNVPIVRRPGKRPSKAVKTKAEAQIKKLKQKQKKKKK